MNYDYIIVGAGSAGCVVANKLSKNGKTSVLLIEAGPADNKSAIKQPGLYHQLLGTEIDWNYLTEKEPFLAQRQIPLARGKVLGGCSSINAMLYVYGNSADYDYWRALGNAGWSYQELLPYFKRLEHDQLGSLQPIQNLHPSSTYFIEAAVALGHQPNLNFNGAEQLGVGLYQTTIKDGKRYSAADAFLHPVQQRTNLQIETDALVSRIIFAGRRALGVVYSKAGVEHVVKANKEIILCAGAINTPQLLLLSGVGPVKTLQALGIPVVVDLPGVGGNLQDHIWVGVTFESSLTVPELTSNACEAGLFMQTQTCVGSAPDLQVDTLVDVLNDANDDYRGVILKFCPITLHPQSRGGITLRSADPVIAPIVQFNYLQDDRDMQPLVEGVKLARKLAQTNPVQQFIGREIFPGKNIVSDDQIKNFIRHHASTLWHPVGTCKMGIDDLAVVDPQLNVYGVSGLRVIDASIMPTITSGNTNAPCLLIGEKGADLVLEDNSYAN